MDSSPRPQRRFSRWQTTKRTFVLAGVTYKPTDTNTVLQDDGKKSGSVKRAKKDYTDTNDKSNKNISNHSSTDSFTKRRHHNSPLVAKPSVARRLCLDTSRRKVHNTNIINPTKTTPAQETANGTVFTVHLARKDSVPHGTTSGTTEICESFVRVDPPVVQEFHLELERVDAGNGGVYEDSGQQNKCALSNISQNKSDASSQSAPEEKSSAVHILPPQRKINVTLNSAPEGVLEDDVVTNEANKLKRHAADDDKSSDGSSTDKENVEKDSAGISVPSQSKKVKKDATLQSVASSTRNVTFEDLNVSQKNTNVTKTSQAAELSARRTGLRNRSLLASPETLMKKRQYPVFNVAEKKIVSDKNVSSVNNVFSIEMESSLNRKTVKKTLMPQLEHSKGKNSSRDILNKTPLPVLDLSKDVPTVNSGSSFNKRTTSKKGSSEFEVSEAKDTSIGNVGSSLKKKGRPKRISIIKSVQKNNSAHQKRDSKNTSGNSSRGGVTTPTDTTSVYSIHSGDSESFSGKSRLRDRSMLPSAEQMQRHRQYPVEFLVPKRRSSLERSVSNSKLKHVEHRDSFSQSELTELSPADTKEKLQGKALKIKSSACESSTSQHKSKKALPSRPHTSLSSLEKSVQHKDSLSQLEQEELSPAATKETIKGKSLKNKNVASESFKGQPKSKKCSPHTSTSSVENSVQHKDSLSQLEQGELSPAATKETIKGKSLKNKNVASESFKGQSKSKKCSPHTSSGSVEKSVQDKGSFLQLEQTELSSAAIKEAVKGKSLKNKNVASESFKGQPKGKKCSPHTSTSSVEKSVQDKGSFLQLEQTELSSAAIKETIKGKPLKNKNVASESFKGQPKSKKCSPHTSTSSVENSVQHKDSLSQLEQGELSPAGTEETIKVKSLKNKKVVCESSKSQHKSMKCSPLENSSLTSVKISKQPTPQRGSLYNSISVEKQAASEDVGLSAKTRIATSCIEKVNNSLSVRCVNSEDTDSLSAKNRLRDRSLLPTPEEVQRHRLYPVEFLLPCRRPSVGKSDSDSRHDVSLKKQHKKVQNTETSSVLEQNELSSACAKKLSKDKSSSNKKQINGASSKRQSETKKSSPTFQHSFLNSLETSTQHGHRRKGKVLLESIHNASVKKSVDIENKELSTKSRTVERAPTHSLSVPDVHSGDTDSLRLKRGLRDRSMLPTPDQVQQQRQYPIEFFLSNRRCSGKSDAKSKHSAYVKEPEKNVVQNKAPDAQLDHAEHSSVSSKTIKEKSVKRNKNEKQANCESRPERKKCASPVQCTSRSSSETLEPPSPQVDSTHNVFIGKPVIVESISDSVKDRINGECVEKTNSKQSTLKVMKKNGLIVADHARTIQTALNLSKTVSMAKSAASLEQRQGPAHKPQKVSEKDSLDGAVENNKTSMFNKKPPSKADRKQYSLPRRPFKKSSEGPRFEKSSISFAEADISFEPLQQSITIVDTTWRRPQKLAFKRHPVQHESRFNSKERQSVGQKPADVKRPDLSVNETVLVPKTVPRKRKLLEELDEAEGTSAQRINEVVNQRGTHGPADGSTRRSCTLSALDVILQAVRDTEDQLLAETEDDALGDRLVRKVMRTFRKKMKPLISDVEEVKDLQHDIRKKNSRIRKLSCEIKEQQQLKSQLNKEIYNVIGREQDLELMNVSETMKGYAQLMQTFANKSR